MFGSEGDWFRGRLVQRETGSEGDWFRGVPLYFLNNSEINHFWNDYNMNNKFKQL